MEEVLDKVVQLKNEGNLKFKAGVQFKGHTLGKNSMIEATASYASALELLVTLDETNPSQRYKEVSISVYLNLAAASLQLDSYDSALNCCNRVLNIDSKNAKALFRRAQCHSGLKDLKSAVDDLKSAINIAPGNKEIRSEYRRMKALLIKQQASESFRQQTEDGLKRLHADAVEEPLIKVTDKWLKSLSIGHLSNNGMVTDEYAWGQSLQQLFLVLRVPDDTRAKDMSIVIKRTGVEIVVKGNVTMIRKFPRPVKVYESIWEIEGVGCIVLTLQKDHSGVDDSKRGYEWWNCLFEGDATIDVDEVCSIGDDLHMLPDREKQAVEKSLWEKSKRSPEEMKELEQAQRDLEQDESRRESSVHKAMSDPKKKAIYEMMQEKFPDIPVEFK